MSTTCNLLANNQLSHLKLQLRRWEQQAREERVSSGYSDLDRSLLGGGFRRGSLVEWLSSGPGSGAGSLALAAAREACRNGRPLVIIDPRNQFYPPAAAALGIDLERALVVRPGDRNEAIWVCDQALRTRGVGAVVCWAEQVGSRWMRRWQLAAERSQALGLVLCSFSERHASCFSEVRLLVEPLAAVGGRRVRIERLRGLGGETGASVELELNHESAVHLDPPAVHATRQSRSAANRPMGKRRPA